MSVSTKGVTDRRELRFESLDEVLADAERLAAAENVKLLGNWSLGQIFKHLAIALNSSIDGVPFKASWFMRRMAGMMKNKFLNKSMPAGFKMNAKMASHFSPSDSLTTDEGIEALRTAVKRMQEESQRVPHVVFGKMTDEEWTKLHLRHAELHLSFAKIDES